MPDQPHPAPVAGRPLVVVAVALLLAAWSLLVAGSATAHDQLVGSEPGDGAVVEEAPSALVLTFSSDQLPVGAAVVVRDGSGADRSDGEPSVAGRTVTQPLQPGLPAGTYTVQWRSVSGDGHPVEGELAFEVTVGAAGAAASEEGEAPDPERTTGGTGEGTDPEEPAEAGAGTEDVAAAGAPAPGAGTGGRSGWVGPVAAGAGLAAVATLLVLALRRSRTPRRGEER